MASEENKQSLAIGDSVWVLPRNRIGIVTRVLYYGVVVIEQDGREYSLWYDELMLIARVKDYQGIIHIPDREG